MIKNEYEFTFMVGEPTIGEGIVLKLKDGREIKIVCLEKESSTSPFPPFDYIFNDEVEDEEKPLELQVIVQTNHPLWEKRHNMDVVKVLATSDAIYRVLVEKLEYDASEATRVRNEWVWMRTSGEEA